MRILIDTNIIIYREDNSELDKELSELFNLLYENKVQVLVHPASKLDIYNDSNEERKRIILSKISAYPQLVSPPNPDHDENFRQIVPKSQNSNDEIDAKLLFSVYRDAVSFLITNDNKLIGKSTKLIISDRVFNPFEANNYFKKYFKKIDINAAPLAIKKVPLHNINLDDPFFDSLKKDYRDFQKWFQEKSEEGNEAWLYYNDGLLGAFLMLKEESESIPDASPIFPYKKRIKISTLKVTATGLKIGELFIKIAIEFTIKKNINEIYLTHFDTDNDSLLPMISNYGFYHFATKPDNEKIYVKQFIPSQDEISPEIISQKYYPSFYDGVEIKKFIIPIRQHYHNLLFQDCQYSERSLFHLSEIVIEGNAIKKAYLSHSKIKKISKYDIVLFYLSKTNRLITALGIVDDIFYDVTESEEIINKVGKRSVYNKTEVEEISQKKTLVILFKWHFYFNDEISYKFLIKECIIKGPPQSIIEIDHSSYLKIKEKGGINNGFTFD